MQKNGGQISVHPAPGVDGVAWRLGGTWAGLTMSLTMRRYVVELGAGADLHGGDVTKAAQRAVRDAVSRSCLCGLFEVVGLEDPNQMRVRVHIACPRPDRVEAEAVRSEIPFGQVTVEVTEGGMVTEGLHLERLGPGSQIVVALAAVTVLVP
jgi:uncharacterized protein (TIGR02058 family)